MIFINTIEETAPAICICFQKYYILIRGLQFSIFDGIVLIINILVLDLYVYTYIYNQIMFKLAFIYVWTITSQIT